MQRLQKPKGSPKDNDLGPIILVLLIAALIFLHPMGGSGPPPFKVKNLSVVFIDISNRDSSPLTPELDNTLNSNDDTSIRQVVAKEGGRVVVVDHNNNTSNEKWVQDAFEAFKKITPEPPLPYMYYGNSHSGGSGPCKPTEAENKKIIFSFSEAKK